MLCSWLTGSDDHAAQYIKSRPLARSPAEDSLDQCLKHYKSCLKHKKCKTAMKRNKHNTVPTRLLDIRPNLQARLCTVPQAKDTLYAALSYRWGSTQQQKDGRTFLRVCGSDSNNLFNLLVHAFCCTIVLRMIRSQQALLNVEELTEMSPKITDKLWPSVACDCCWNTMNRIMAFEKSLCYRCC
jgi:hypothetical protein